MRLSSTFEKIGRQFAVEFSELSRETDHRGSAGEARERALMDLLRKYIPQRVAVDRGFVIDAAGCQSGQIDIVIYDRSVGTVFEVGGLRYFPCETVVAVGQVKADVTSQATLADALENIRSVKALDRSNRGTNLAITGPGISTPQIVSFDPATKHRDQIFGFVFTHMSLTTESLVNGLRTYCRAHPKQVWPNLLCAFGALLATYANEGGQIYPSAMEAKRFVVSKAEECDNLLLLFFCMLASFIDEAHIARPSFFDYAQMATTLVEHHEI